MDYIQLPIKKLDNETLKQCEKLVDTGLGVGYFKDHIPDVSNVWLCYDEEKIVAWATTSDREDYAILKCIVVDKKYRRKGIAKRLTELRLAFLKVQGFSKAKSYAWVHQNGECPSCKNLEKLGFTVSEDRFNFYKTYCPECGHYCNCVARVLEKKL